MQEGEETKAFFVPFFWDPNEMRKSFFFLDDGNGVLFHVLIHSGFDVCSGGTFVFLSFFFFLFSPFCVTLPMLFQTVCHFFSSFFLKATKHLIYHDQRKEWNVALSIIAIHSAPPIPLTRFYLRLFLSKTVQ